MQLKGKCKISNKDKINWSLIFGRPKNVKRKEEEEEEKRREEEEPKRYEILWSCRKVLVWICMVFYGF